MSFDERDIHPPLDVFTRDNVYVGSVLRVEPPADAAPGGREQIVPGSLQTSRVNGELLGPMPTEPIGNRAPATQSAQGRFRADPDAARPLTGGSLVVGRWWGLVGRRTIPLALVQNVSLERVVLAVTYGELTGTGAAADRNGASAGGAHR